MSSNPFTSDELFRQPLSESQKRYVPETGSGSIRDPGDSILLGESVAVRRLRSQIRRIAPYFRIALLRGEIGSGKQLVARSIHALSPGAAGPFVVLNACVLAETLGRAATRPTSAASVLESARGGTLYLKGVGELSFGLQEMLLRFLRMCEERRATAPTTLTRFHQSDTGIADARSLDARGMGTRILAASDRDLRTLSAIGQFRQDLYAHLSAVEILVPPLRQRIEDIPILAAWLLRRLAEASGQVPKLLAEATLLQLRERAWPSNILELERVIAQASALAEAGLIEPRHLLALVEPRAANPAVPPAIRMERLHDVMLRHVLDVLTRCSGNKVRAAELLGISRSTLYRMLGTGSAAAHSLAE